MKWKPAAVAGTTLVIALAIYLYMRDDNGSTPTTQTPPARHTITAEGKLEARPGAEMDVGTAMTARIERFLVYEGDHVDKGQVIAVLAAEELTARLHQSEAVLQRAQSEQLHAEMEFDRAVQLHKDKFMSQSALDNAEITNKIASAKVSEAKADVRYVRSLLDKTRVASPISGTLIERYLDVGEVAMPEKPLAAIADTSRLRVNAEVDETDAGRLHLDDPVEITAYAYPGQVYKGRVEEIAHYVGKREIKPNNPAVNLGLKIIQVKIALLEETPLKLGMTVDVRIMPTEK
ncbi:MAG: efflux RND transporter periplasmic adaptor subunit [Pseudomonadota bacterium]